jgi:TPR repeat protein
MAARRSRLAAALLAAVALLACVRLAAAELGGGATDGDALPASALQALRRSGAPQAVAAALRARIAADGTDREALRQLAEMYQARPACPDAGSPHPASARAALPRASRRPPRALSRRAGCEQLACLRRCGFLAAGCCHSSPGQADSVVSHPAQRGHGVPQDDATAADFFQRAADLGDPSAQARPHCRMPCPVCTLCACL